MNTWAARIRDRMTELNLTQEELANKLGVTRGAVTHYLSGRRVPPLRQFQKIAMVLKSDPAWLQFGATTNATSTNKKSDTKKEAIQPLRQPIAILSWTQAAEFSDVSKLNPKEIKETIPHLYTDQPGWYALRVKGDAMTSPLGQKSFLDGNIIIVDPNHPVKNGSFVVAVLPRAKEATFKQYVIDGGVKYLKPINPQYPLVEINDKTTICGVVIGCLS